MSADEESLSPAALRKRKQREREKALGMKKEEQNWARGERKIRLENAATRGFEDITEYQVWLVLEDRKALERDGSQIKEVEV